MSSKSKRAKLLPRYWACVALGIVLTLSSGIVYGRLSQRWGPSPNLTAAADNLQTFPTRIGDWDMIEEKPINDSAVRMLDCAGYIHREYVNRKSGQTVSMFVIVGPPGPTAVHTPEICYSSRDFSLQGMRRKETLVGKNANSHSFWAVRLGSNNVLAPQAQSVYYAWNDGEGWSASESPRFEFGGKPMLYKIQVVGLVTRDSDTEAQSPSHGFLTELLKSQWEVTAS